MQKHQTYCWVRADIICMQPATIFCLQTSKTFKIPVTPFVLYPYLVSLLPSRHQTYYGSNAQKLKYCGSKPPCITEHDISLFLFTSNARSARHRAHHKCKPLYISWLSWTEGAWQMHSLCTPVSIGLHVEVRRQIRLWGVSIVLMVSCPLADLASSKKSPEPSFGLTDAVMHWASIRP